MKNKTSAKKSVFFSTTFRESVPFFLPFISKILFAFISLTWLFCFINSPNSELIMVFLPLFTLGSFFLETVFYRVFKFKNSRFHEPDHLQEKLEITPEQLDFSALKINKVKWVFLAIVAFVATLIHAFNDFKIFHTFFVATSFFGTVGLMLMEILIYHHIISMPKVIHSYEPVNAHNPSPMEDTYRTINLANGYDISTHLVPPKSLSDPVTPRNHWN